MDSVASVNSSDSKKKDNFVFDYRSKKSTKTAIPSKYSSNYNNNNKTSTPERNPKPCRL